MSRNLIVVLIVLAVVAYLGITTETSHHKMSGTEAPRTGESGAALENTTTTGGTGGPSAAKATNPNAGVGAPRDKAADASVISAVPGSTGSTQQAANADGGREYLPQEVDIVKQISSFLQNEYFLDKPRYMEVVDYFERGVVSRETVLQDIDRYARRWPHRRYELVPGSLHVTPKGEDRYLAAFDYIYVVSNGPRQASGRASGLIALVAKGGQFYVAGVREEVRRDRR